MTKILFITCADNQHFSVEAQNGMSLMEVALQNEVPGIIAECGGACSCATCQVYIDETWIEKVGSPNIMEEDMLDFAYEPMATSRLSCQITICDELDGLVVHIPEKQA